MNKLSVFVFTGLFFFTGFLSAQEALKSTEEEYYDFLSLTGIVERPTLGYRTLSDSVWNFKEIESFEENSDGTYTKVRVPGKQSDGNIWKNNNLGTTYTLWQPSAPADNWFARGLKQGLTARIFGPEWFNSYNTAAPYGQNDGALWQGKGYNTALTTGLRLEGYGFELTFKPQISWSQNREFESNKAVYPSPYSYTFHAGTVYHAIDLVQRYGDKSFFTYDWGDTEVRWTLNTLTFGFGTQNPWLGPAYLNPMLGSNNAPGYFKFDAGLRKTEVKIPFIGWSLGYIEGRIWLGQLEESDYFDTNPDNNKRMLTGMSASYNPSFIPGFTVGLNRVFMTYWKAENVKNITRLLKKDNVNSTGNGNDEDQKFSIFVDWIFPKIGFEVYGEFGRDDFSNDEKSNPFHTAIYTVGAKQYIPLPFNLRSELNIEWNNFETSQDYQFVGYYPGYYSHGFVNQGYTNRGQSLGSATCWAGNSQLIQYKVLYPKGYTAIKFHRFCPNNNSIYGQAANTSADAFDGPIYDRWYANFETYFVYGIESNYFIFSDLNLDAAFNYVYIRHRNYSKWESVNNFNMQIMIKYNL